MTASLREQIARQARAAFPRECCGLLEGVCDSASVHVTAAHVTAVHPTRNLAREDDRFEIDPLEQFALLRAARARGGEIIGCYHSHPNGRGEPSARDLRDAGEEGFLWLIAATTKAEIALRAFVYEARAFREIAFTGGAE